MDAKGKFLVYSGSVPIYTVVCCKVRSSGVIPVYKYLDVCYLFSYCIRHLGSCLMIWDHFIWLQVIHERCTCFMIWSLVYEEKMLSVFFFHLVWLQYIHVVQEQCLLLGLWSSWGGHWIHCWIWIYCESVVLKREGILCYLLLVNFLGLILYYYLLK